MVYRGHIRNGAVVLDQSPELPDGTEVSVQPVEGAAETEPGTAQAILQVAGTWQGDGGELDRLLDELRRDKWSEVEAEKQRLP